MKLLQFTISQTALFGGDSSWRLPTAFYHATGRIDDMGVVAKAVKQCADSTGYKNEVIVIKDGAGLARPRRRASSAFRYRALSAITVYRENLFGG
jgi:hypothetical protein